jgi:hypothetical protein
MWRDELFVQKFVLKFGSLLSENGGEHKEGITSTPSYGYGAARYGCEREGQ